MPAVADASKPADAEPKKDEAKKATMPAWDLDDAYLRVRRITSAPGNEGNLEVLPAHGFTLSCFPVKVRGGSAGFTRAVAIFED